jgi:hypothetical protein
LYRKKGEKNVATPNPIFMVGAHREINGRQVSEDFVLYVQAPDGNYGTLAPIINANGVVPGSGALALASVANALPGNVLIG